MRDKQLERTVLWRSAHAIGDAGNVPASLHADWRRYRRLKLSENRALGVWLIALMALLPNESPLHPYRWLLPIPFIWLLVANYLSTTWPCPRCGKALFKQGAVVAQTWSQECVHCGLAKWANDAPMPTDPPHDAVG